MTSTRKAGRRPDDDGAVVMVIAAMILFLGGFLALVLNIAHALGNRNELLAAADSAALAGAISLDGTPEGLEVAKARSVDFAKKHLVDKDAINIDGDDVTPGCWDLAATPATKWNAFKAWNEVGCTQPRNVNAVRVKTARDGELSHNAEKEVFFGGLLGKKHMKVRSEAVAIGGGPAEGCVIPFAVLDCHAGLAADLCNKTITLNLHGNAKLTGLDQGANNNTFRDLVRCDGGRHPSECCHPIGNLPNISTQNGTDFNKQLAELMLPYVAADVGNPNSWVHVPVIPCTGNADVLGFLRVKVRGVCSNSGNFQILEPGFTCSVKASLLVTVSCLDETSPAGGTNYGTAATNVRIVR
jgi:Flp pilus assembly protein TadG